MDRLTGAVNEYSSNVSRLATDLARSTIITSDLMVDNSSLKIAVQEAKSEVELANTWTKEHARLAVEAKEKEVLEALSTSIIHSGPPSGSSTSLYSLFSSRPLNSQIKSETDCLS